MAKTPLLVFLAMDAQVLPAIAWSVSRGRTRAATAIAIGGLLGGLGDIVSGMLARNFGNNHVATYIDAPMMTVCFLAALREWQVTAKERRNFGFAVILYLLVCILLVAFLEDVRSFNFGVGPLSSLALLTAGVWTLLRNTMIVEQTPLPSHDWFWIALGLAVQGATTALASPIGGMMLEKGRIDLIDITWQVRGVLVIVSYGLIAWGIFRGPTAPRFAAGR